MQNFTNSNNSVKEVEGNNQLETKHATDKSAVYDFAKLLMLLSMQCGSFVFKRESDQLAILQQRMGNLNETKEILQGAGIDIEAQEGMDGSCYLITINMLNKEFENLSKLHKIESVVGNKNEHAENKIFNFCTIK